MKFYVASKLDDRAQVQRMMRLIESKGHEVILDWTQDSLLPKPYEKLQASHRSERDIQGVMECDVFVLYTEGESTNKGMYVELGAAIASSLIKGTPTVFVIGDFTEYGVFFFHPLVKRMKTLQDVLAEVERK